MFGAASSIAAGLASYELQRQNAYAMAYQSQQARNNAYAMAYQSQQARNYLLNAQLCPPYCGTLPAGIQFTCSYCRSQHSKNRCPNCGASQPMEKKA